MKSACCSSGAGISERLCEFAFAYYYYHSHFKVRLLMEPTLEAWLEEGNRMQSSTLASVFVMQISSNNCKEETCQKNLVGLVCEFFLLAIVLPEVKEDQVSVCLTIAVKQVFRFLKLILLLDGLY